jgi:hypothetical protein
MEKRFLFCLIGLVAASMSFAQQSTLSGNVFKKQSGKETAVWSVIYLLNADSTVSVGAKSDFDGLFSLQATPGQYILKVVDSETNDKHYQNLVIKSGENEPLKILMAASILDLAVVQVFAKSQVTSQAAANESVKLDLGTKSVQTAEQISSTGSSDTKEALTKMSGINSTNSVVYVRGMGDRYNAAYLNGLPVPSPNPELRVIPMDILPTSIIDLLEVGKFMAPNLYGDFAGGAINIKTKKSYTKPTFNVSIGSGFNTMITGTAFTTYEGGRLDFMGIDDGTRSLPSEVATTSQKNATAIYRDGIYKSDDYNRGTGFTNNFNTHTVIAKPASSFKFEGGGYKKLESKGKGGRGLGFVSMISQGNSYQKQLGTSRFINAQNKLDYNFDTKSQTYSTSTTGLFTGTYDLHAKSSVSLNYLYINNSDDQVFETWGYHRDFGDNGEEVFARRMTFTQNQIHNFQLIGKHDLSKKMSANWGASYSTTKSIVPDRRQLAALYTDREDTGHYKLIALDANSTHRFYSSLNEKEVATHGDLSYNVFENKSGDTLKRGLKLIGGVDVKEKNRLFHFRQFNYLAKGLANEVGNNFNISTPDAYLNDQSVQQGKMEIEESANPGNGYEAYQTVFAGNLGAVYTINQQFELIPNIRIEKGFQSVSSRNQIQAQKIEVNIIDGLDIMPSVASKWEVKPNHLIRSGISRTITRPKFFEVAPFEYLAQIAGMAQVGNPNLHNGTNYNAELRYEIYSDKTADYISFGGFGKRLIDPIEQIMRPSAGGQLISFNNTGEGTVAGVEFEYSKNLASFVSEGKRQESKWKEFSLAGNAAYIYSEIKIEDKTGFTTNTRRPLQGASPYMANISLKWDKHFSRSENEFVQSRKHIMTALSFSYSGRSLFAVGTQGVGDQYQFSNYNLNFVSKIEFNSMWSIGLTAKNLTNNLFQVMQQDVVNKGQWQEVNSYRKGMDISFNISFKLLSIKERKALEK